MPNLWEKSWIKVLKNPNLFIIYHQINSKIWKVALKNTKNKTNKIFVEFTSMSWIDLFSLKIISRALKAANNLPKIPWLSRKKSRKSNVRTKLQSIFIKALWKQLKHRCTTQLIRKEFLLTKISLMNSKNLLIPTWTKVFDFFRKLCKDIRQTINNIWAEFVIVLFNVVSESKFADLFAVSDTLLFLQLSTESITQKLDQ